MHKYEKTKSNFTLDNVATDYLLTTPLLNKLGTKVTDKHEQKHKGDVKLGTNKYVDFKFDRYENANIVIEEHQVSDAARLAWALG